MEFEKQRQADEAEVKQFKEGIVRMMSNLMVYKVKQDYMDNKQMFDNHSYDIHDHQNEQEDQVFDSEDEDKESTKEESAAKFPFFWQ